MMDLNEFLRSNSYPGRGILLGRSADDTKAVIAYFIMGRSENSRNRVFEATEDGIRTRAYDESKMTDPSLIIYHPVRAAGRGLVVTNGDQTDTIRDHLLAGKTFQEALRTRAFEPDGPNYTPRISGLLSPDGSYKLSILKSAEGDPACCQRFFFEYDAPIAGQGHFLSTYEGDGDPLPSFRGEPRAVALPERSLKDFGDALWESLNSDNRVSLYVACRALSTGETQSILYNRHEA